MSFLINIKREEDTLIFYYDRSIWELKWDDATKKQFPSDVDLYRFFEDKIVGVAGTHGRTQLKCVEPLAMAVINKLVQW